MKRKLPDLWKRRPLPDCPVCDGNGMQVVDAQLCNGSTMPFPWACPCVRFDKPRGTDPAKFLAMLERYREGYRRHAEKQVA